MISLQEIQDAWARLMRPDGWQQADGDRVTFRSQIIDGVQYIDFQGSSETVDWLMDFDFWPKYNFHRGYINALMDAFQYLKINMMIPHVISGYSCGGAFALLVAYFINDYCDIKGNWAKIITFAAPRVFSIHVPKFSQNLEIYNMQVTGDPVVHLPPKWLGYRDNPGQVMRFKAQLSIKAHSPEVYGDFIK